MQSVNLRINSEEIEVLLWLLRQPIQPRNFADGRPINYVTKRDKLTVKMEKMQARMDA